MEGVGLALSAVQTLLAALQCSQLNDFLSHWGYKSQLESLRSTVTSIQAVLSDMDAMEAEGSELTAQQLDFIHKLKDVVYDADDLLDEFATLAALQQRELQNSEKVRRFVSRLENFFGDFKRSQKLKDIRRKLDRIASDTANYSFKVKYQPMRKRREETCSYVYEKDIVGREDDKRRIIDMLLESNVQEDISVLSIVGMGGLGKTALAQLVYNDPEIQKEFPLRLWVCISDQDKNQFKVKTILADVLKSTGERHIDDLNLDQLVKKLREKLDRSKYLLVLDDVWTENHGDWCELRKHLVRQRENKIMVTTRSKQTAEVIKSNHCYELHGLSNDSSWRLFEMVVGSSGLANCPEKVKLGEDIVKKCANVPLAIKVIGSLLCGQSMDTWRSIQRSRLMEINNDENGIMSILKLSYFHLFASLKNCFTYCALFPKDFRIKKDMLVNLWMAHDYVKPLKGCQSLEEAADEYFQILVRRCFFQDLEENEIGETLTFKIHDLLHDMAQQVAGNDILVVDSTTSSADIKSHHIFDSAIENYTNDSFFTSINVRTYIKNRPPFFGGNFFYFPVSALLLTNWRSVRALDLSFSNIESLPNLIGKLLLHLRYLDLSNCRILKMLPKSFTKLINLKFLNLDRCQNLEQLPNDFNKLVNLRTLYVYSDIGLCQEADGLRYMPLGMDKLSSLRKLNKFVVGERKSSVKQDGGRLVLESIRGLRNLKGHLQICVTDDYKHVKENDEEGKYLCNLQYLSSISIKWVDEKIMSERMHSSEDLLEDLRPHSNIRELDIENYVGVRIPSWARADKLVTFLPNLVKIVISDCSNLQEFPWLGKLPSLKTLQLSRLYNLEYMEDNTESSNATRTVGNTESSIFFPSLQELNLIGLHNLKGWWKGSDDEKVNTNKQTSSGHLLPSFPRLSQLIIRYCPQLTSIPLCTTVDTLELKEFNKSLHIMKEEQDLRMREEGGSLRNDSKLRVLETDNARYLNSLPMVAFQCLTKMEIDKDKEVESLSKVKKVFRSCSSSLLSLDITSCYKLRRVSEGLEYLNALESLTLSYLPKLRFDEANEEEEERTGMPWKSLAKCLRSLELDQLHKVYNLPKGMRYLTALQSLKISILPLEDVPEWIGCLSSLHSLTIRWCHNLQSLPEALRNLTSLKQLQLDNCNQILHRRCKEKNGEYWPRIQHIHDIHNEFSN